MKKIIFAMLFVSGALVAGMNQNNHSFGEFDADGNGRITQSEFENAQQKNMIANANAGKQMRNAGNAPTFNMVDTNKDGYIDMQEFQVQLQKNRQRHNGQKKGMKKKGNR